MLHSCPQSSFPVAVLQAHKDSVLSCSGEPDGCRANYSPPGGAASRAGALNIAVLGHHQESSPRVPCQHPFHKATLCVRGGRLLVTINLLLAGQGRWGPGMCRSLGLPVPAALGPLAPSHPLAPAVVSGALPVAAGHGASEGTRLPHPGSLLTWAWDKALSPVLLLFVPQGEAIQDPGAGQVPAGASWAEQTLKLAGGFHAVCGCHPLLWGAQGWCPVVSTLSQHSQLLQLLPPLLCSDPAAGAAPPAAC